MSIINRITRQVTGRAGRGRPGRGVGGAAGRGPAGSARRQDEAIGRGVRKLLRRAR
jgi:ribosomal protein L15